MKRALVYRLNHKILSVVSKVLQDPSKRYRILDAGCGEGFISMLLVKKFPNAIVTGIDQSQEALEMARRVHQIVRYRQGSIYRMPFRNHSFDLVICTEVLEHLESPYFALKELNRVVKRGGAVLLTVPAEPWFCMGNFLVMKNVRRFGNPIDHINHWTYRGFIKYIRTFLITSNSRCILKAWPCFPWSVALYQKLMR